ncbi:1,2-dihydroxy-3-keto-5-methylthiopentene dioxygenase-like [Sitophilus oryzae]|uniref:acireductone dioxygenase (Fe(2+)-requiring) n=1 Tax=Sitophilus oryzae TaxID=7048 RepID=A0A6J2XDR7_SITOR|nr:1,2-dihydroxy-3-keto-5-methylthiopentene dioxygenase-like [Sitophilus oryzae]XP_030748929.1 1,2-dihydroxy-3-keto-5-methylthiopentene dioxygenase-like [Sitophilus oryzae]
MVRAWLLSEEKILVPKFISLEELYKTSGIEYYQIDINNYENDPLLKNLIEQRDNHNINKVEGLDDTDLINHNTEHFHEHDEFRLVIHGSGYFDVRDKYDEWIRIEMIPGDLIVIPGGCYHRFVVEGKVEEYKGLRFLKDYGYKAFNRPNDELECRKAYMRRLYNGAYDDIKQ